MAFSYESGLVKCTLRSLLWQTRLQSCVSLRRIAFSILPWDDAYCPLLAMPIRYRTCRSTSSGSADGLCPSYFGRLQGKNSSSGCVGSVHGGMRKCGINNSEAGCSGFSFRSSESCIHSLSFLPKFFQLVTQLSSSTSILQAGRTHSDKSPRLRVGGRDGVDWAYFQKILKSLNLIRCFWGCGLSWVCIFLVL